MAYTFKTRQQVDLKSLPLQASLKNGRKVVLERAQADTISSCRALYNAIIEEGCWLPLAAPLDEEVFAAQFLAFDLFVLRSAEGTEVIGVMLIRPNFPGRASHVATAQLAVQPSFRNQGAGGIMMRAFVQLARELGYQSAFFPLIFEQNLPIQRLLSEIGCECIGRIPEGAHLASGVYVDCLQYSIQLT